VQSPDPAKLARVRQRTDPYDNVQKIYDAQLRLI
jgi:hypothetical protein